jgi:hypothetical protein
MPVQTPGAGRRKGQDKHHRLGPQNSFTAHYKESPLRQAPSRPAPARARKITKEAIFHYCYAVLHDPGVPRKSTPQKPQARIPRASPLYGHVAGRPTSGNGPPGGEALDGAAHRLRGPVAPFPARARTDTPDDKSPAPPALPPKSPSCAPTRPPVCITLDSENHSARRPPPEAWTYKTRQTVCALGLGARPVQGKEAQGTPTIREKFDTYRFADHKEKSHRPAGPA